MIGSGKSAVAEKFQQLGALIIDADILARQAVLPGSTTLRVVLQTFGEQFLSADGSLDRKALGALVFSDIEKRKALEAIVHPRVRELWIEALEQALQGRPKPKLVIYVVPLLFESGASPPGVDQTLLVCAPRQQCLERIMQRDNCNQALAAAKYDAQMPESQKRAQADYVLENDTSIEELHSKVQTLWLRLTGSR
jgi:dephospho-CoA kinase